MQVARHSILIARTREDVFDFFVDLTKASRWRQYVESMEVTTGMPVRQGSRIRTTFNLNGERATFDMEVLALVRPALWRHQTFEPNFSGYVEYRFEPEGEGTRVTFTIQARPKTLYGWLAIPIMWLNKSKTYREQLPQLKRALEET